MELGLLLHSRTFGVVGKLAVVEHLGLGELGKYEWKQDMTGRLSIKRSSFVSDSRGQGCPAGSVRTMAMLDVGQVQASCHPEKKLRVDRQDRGLSQTPEQK